MAPLEARKQKSGIRLNQVRRRESLAGSKFLKQTPPLKTPTSPKQAAVGDTIVVALGPKNGSDDSDDPEILLVKAEPRVSGHHASFLSRPSSSNPQTPQKSIITCNIGATIDLTSDSETRESGKESGAHDKSMSPANQHQNENHSIIGTKRLLSSNSPSLQPPPKRLCSHTSLLSSPTKGATSAPRFPFGRDKRDDREEETAEVRKLKQTLKKLEDDKRELGNKLRQSREINELLSHSKQSAADEEREALRNQDGLVQRLEAEDLRNLEQVQNQLRDSQENHASLLEEAKTLSNALEGAKRDAVKAEEERQNISKALEVARKTLVKADQGMKETHKALEKTEAEKKALTDKISVFEGTQAGIWELRGRAKKLEDRNHELEADKKTLSADYDSVCKEVAKVKADNHTLSVKQQSLHHEAAKQSAEAKADHATHNQELEGLRETHKNALTIMEKAAELQKVKAKKSEMQIKELEAVNMKLDTANKKFSGENVLMEVKELELISTRKKMGALTTSYEQLERELEAANAKLADERASFEVKELELVERRKRMATLIPSQEQLAKDKTALAAQVTILEHAKTDLEDRAQKSDGLQKKVDDLQIKLSSQREASRKACALSEKSVEKIKQKLQDREERIESLGAEVKNLTTRLGVAETDTIELRDQVKKTMGSLENEKKGAERKDRELCEAHGSMREAQAELRTLSSELQSVEERCRELRQANGSLREVQADKNSLKAEVEAQEGKVKSLSTEVQSLRGKNKKACEMIDGLQLEHQNGERFRQGLAQELDRCRLNMKDLGDKNSSLQEQLATLNETTAARSRHDEDALKSTLASRDVQITQLRKRIDEVIDSHNELVDELDQHDKAEKERVQSAKASICRGILNTGWGDWAVNLAKKHNDKGKQKQVVAVARPASGPVSSAQDLHVSSQAPI